MYAGTMIDTRGQWTRGVGGESRSKGHGFSHFVSRFDSANDTTRCRHRYSGGMSATGSWFTLREAAAVSDKSRVTLRRYLDAGRFPNARQDESDPNRPWLISLSDLKDAGVLVATDTGGVTHDDPTMMLIVRLSVAEALADERAAEISRLEGVFETFTAQAAAMVALTERGQ